MEGFLWKKEVIFQENLDLSLRQQEAPKKMSTNDGEAPAPVKADRKVGRNDPCPCGSGKKYKNCCGRNV